MVHEKICENLNSAEKQLLMSRNLKHKLMTNESFISKNVQIALECLERELKRQCEPFDFETEACIFMSYQGTGITR